MNAHQFGHGEVRFAILDRRFRTPQIRHIKYHYFMMRKKSNQISASGAVRTTLPHDELLLILPWSIYRNCREGSPNVAQHPTKAACQQGMFGWQRTFRGMSKLRIDSVQKNSTMSNRRMFCIAT